MSAAILWTRGWNGGVEVHFLTLWAFSNHFGEFRLPAPVGSNNLKIRLTTNVTPSAYNDHRHVMIVVQVCGLKWSPDHQHLASGGNDNKLFVWNMNNLSPVQTYTEHLAAVKAIAWSPHQHGLLASGGGTADRCIRFWNTLTGQPLQCVDTGSQVCNLAWSKHANELVSAERHNVVTTVNSA